MIKSHVTPLVAVSLISAALAGCGGSSSSDSGDGDSTGGAFTESNYKTVLKSGFAGFGAMTESVDLFSENFIDSSSQSSFSLKQQRASVEATCDTGSGSVNTTEATTGQITTGDSVVGTFDNCATTFPFGGSFTMDGGFSMTVVAASGGVVSGDFSSDGVLENQVTYTNFAMNINALGEQSSFKMNGNVTVSQTIASPLTTGEISSSGLTMQFTENGVQESFDLLSMDAKFIADSSNNQETDEMDLSFRDTIDGSLTTITFDTTAPFKTADGQDNPYEGSATITSSGGGAIQLTANSDAETVILKLDVDGDGTYEFTDNAVPWSEINDEDEGSQSS